MTGETGNNLIVKEGVSLPAYFYKAGVLMIKRKRDRIGFKQLSQSEATAILFYVFLGLIAGARGVTFLRMTTEEMLSSPWYMAIDSAIDIKAWGAILVLFSALLLVSVLSSSTPYFLLTISCNTVLGITFILLGGAAVDYSVSSWTLFTHMALALAHTMLAVIGGYWLWIKKKSNTTM